MKKVLALVLAAIMVCTMAFAVTTSGVTADGDTAATSTKMTQLIPGDSIVLDYDDLGIASGEDHAKYTVTVKTTGPIASQGWVKISSGYVYALNTVADETKVIDGNPDIVIESIVVKKVGQAADVLNKEYTKVEDGVTKYVATSTAVELIATDTSKAVWKTIDELKAQSAVNAKMAFDLGRVVNAATTKIEITDAGAFVAPTGNNSVFYSVVRAAANTTKNTGKLTQELDTDLKMAVTYSINNGEKVIACTVTSLEVPAKLTDNLVANSAAIKADSAEFVCLNKPATITVDNAKDGYKIYMVNSDGTVRDLGATFDSNKVLTATAKITGPVIVTDKAITATAASTGSTGTTTNPETGANDVIGVAAALAVVALVSGAAISLKK